MSNPNTQNDFSKGSIVKNIMNLAIPMTLAQLINVLYNIVDRIYIGRIPDHATLSLTGIGLSLPIITLVIAFANLFGMGGAPLCSIERGRGDIKEAEAIMGNSFSMMFISGVLLTLLCLIFRKPMLYLFGASDATYPYANAYITIYLLGSLFVMVGLGMNSFINSQGFGCSRCIHGSCVPSCIQTFTGTKQRCGCSTRSTTIFQQAEENSRSLMQRFGALEVAMRQNDLAFEVQAYLKTHPCAAVVNLGCGLDNTGRACDNGRCKIYNLDFPDVIALRQQLLPAGEREQNIPCDLKDPAWFDKYRCLRRGGVLCLRGVLLLPDGAGSGTGAGDGGRFPRRSAGV